LKIASAAGARKSVQIIEHIGLSVLFRCYYWARSVPLIAAFGKLYRCRATAVLRGFNFNRAAYDFFEFNSQNMKTWKICSKQCRQVPAKTSLI
jgi:hypothetical protein